MDRTGRRGGQCPPPGRWGASAGQRRGLVGSPEGMDHHRPHRAGTDLRRGPRLSLGAGTQDRAPAIRMHRQMGRQSPDVQRKMGAPLRAAALI
ncbi:hypothetical protein RirG_033700 [Rhizophagus irregularis DAOM 197198w]|uniref:Uncharacterized protein n=1 Tax=Rhizophagus irregularis (strain DAOM 197198w) TaxID=1432141 RepID=A0A015L9K0_RHIIW|nr:hypothetical protein RirG_033700 [Rhizophagus irregularis DAOM 197198w]